MLKVEVPGEGKITDFGVKYFEADIGMPTVSLIRVAENPLPGQYAVEEATKRYDINIREDQQVIIDYANSGMAMSTGPWRIRHVMH
jgi:hypothetical protein